MPSAPISLSRSMRSHNWSWEMTAWIEHHPSCASGSTGNIFWRDGIYAETEQQQAGTMQVSYYDAQTGTQLCTGSIAITLPTSTQTKP